MSTSTCESEVNSILDAVNEAEYLNDLIEELDFSSKIQKPIVYNDNQSANISCVTNGKFQVNRHYRLRLGRIREAVQSKLIDLKFCPSEEMCADLLTKAFAETRLSELCESIGLI